MKTAVTNNNNKEETKMDSMKRKTEASFEPKNKKTKTLPQPKNENKLMAKEEENSSRDDYIEPSEDERRILMEEGTKNKKKTIANGKEKNLRDLYDGTSRESEESRGKDGVMGNDLDETIAKIIKTAKLERKIAKLKGKLEASNKIKLKRESQSLRAENSTLSLHESAFQKDEAVNEKEKDEEKITRPKRATKTTFDFNTFVYSIGQRIPREKKNDSNQDANMTLQITLTDSDSESDMEELRPPPEDLVFNDIYSATRNLDKADKEKLVNMHKSWQIVWTCPKRRYEIKPKHCHKLVSSHDTIDSVIGSWMSILEDKFANKPNVPSCYLGNIYFRAFVRRKSTNALNKELDKMKGKRLICFPVCTPISGNPDAKPNHWTLIVLDVKERKWTHFNTLPGIGTDWNYHHNQELMDWVDENLREEYVETVEPVSPVVETKMSQVTNPERENYKDTPHQPNGSYDCGICLLMILEQLMLGKTKEQIKDLFEFNEEEIAKYRTRMVQTFLRLGKIQKEQNDVAGGIIPGV